MAWNGLSDWETGGQLDDPQIRASSLAGKKDFAAARQLRKMNKGNFRSLVELYNARNTTGGASIQGQQPGEATRLSEEKHR